MANKKNYKSEAKKAVKAAKKNPKIIVAAAILLAVVIAVIAVLWFFKPDIFHKFLGTGGHSWSEWETLEEADCINDGFKFRYCTVCEDEDYGDIPATGHKWESGWTVTKQATCSDGVKEHGCTKCTEIETEAIPAVKQHTFGEWTEVLAATCGDGRRERVCPECDTVEFEITEGTGEHNFGDDGICAVCGFDGNDGEGSETEIPSAELSIHFLELGNKFTGDCTLIKCGDTEILIDAGSRNNSAATIKAYVDRYCTDGVLEYVIATHAHQDHIAGFVGNKDGDTRTGILYQYEIGTLIQFAGHKTNSQIYKDYCTAVSYAESRGTAVYTANQCWNQTDGAQKSYYLDQAETVSMNILYNYYYDHTTSDENDYSVCMLLTQETAGKTYNYLFTGDLEEKGEGYLVENNDLPEVELFKGGHHGSYTASTEKLLSVIKPKNIAVCCCCGAPEYTKNPDNTFPSQKFIDRAGKYTSNIYCTSLATGVPEVGSNGEIISKTWEYTSMNGNIVFYTKGGKLKLWCSNDLTVLKETDWFKQNRVWSGV